MTKRNAQSSGDERWLNIRIAREKVDRLRVVAKADHRNVSQEVRRLIDERLESSELSEAA